MRAFRPSRCIPPEEMTVELAQAAARAARVRVYASRAKAHLPLFREKPGSFLESPARVTDDRSESGDPN